jgi:hypothetical protein
LVVVNTSARKVTATGSEGANPLQARVILDPAGPVVGETAQLALAWMATVVLVVPVDSGVRSAGVTKGGAEVTGAALGVLVARAVQPVTARVAAKTTVAMI